MFGLSGNMAAKASELPKAHLPSGNSICIVTTIRPIYSLTAAITQGVTNPRLLLTGQTSPHHYALRPSEVRLLKDADVVFWIGPDLETFLPKVLGALSREKAAVRLDKSPGLSTWPIRRGVTWETHTHGDHEHGHHADDGEHEHHYHDHAHASQTDPHIWLSVPNAIRMAKYITQILSQRDPVHKALYLANAKRLCNRLEELDRSIKQSLRGLNRVPFLVFHDGYQYFEKAYGLNGVGAIVLDTELSPSVHRVRSIKQTIEALGVRCVFSEPQFDPKLVDMLTTKQNAKLKRGVLDPIGRQGNVPEDEYVVMMQTLSHEIANCLR